MEKKAEIVIRGENMEGSKEIIYEHTQVKKMLHRVNVCFCPFDGVSIRIVDVSTIACIVMHDILMNILDFRLGSLPIRS